MKEKKKKMYQPPEYQPKKEPITPDINETYKQGHQFRGMLKHMLPFLNGKEDDDVVLAQILITLKLEGVLGEDLSITESELANVIKESVLVDESKKNEAINLYKNIKKQYKK